LTITKPIPAAASDPRIPAALARVGFAARGIVYVLIAAFAIAPAFRSGEHAHGFTTAVEALLRKPLGGVLATAIACGLACLAGFLALDGLARTRTAGDSQRWLIGAAMIGDALLYVGFVAVIVAAVFGSAHSGDPQVQGWTAWVLSLPAGDWIVALGGALVVVAGLGDVVWAWTGNVDKRLVLPPDQKRLTEPISRYGLTGRGAALVMIGVFFVIAAVDGNPAEAHELGGALDHLRHRWLGSTALLLFASGFVASAFFDFLAAVYRRTQPGAD